ncbi:MAG: S8 family serine peptidase [Planctomycetes bacterium]|nr:S8 family serine peptidase [Planctomycetota bacterium]
MRISRYAFRTGAVVVLALVWFLAGGSPAPREGDEDGGLFLARGGGRALEPREEAHGHLHGHDHAGEDPGCCARPDPAFFAAGKSPDRLVPIGVERDRELAGVDVEVARGQVLFKIEKETAEDALLAIERRFGKAPKSLGGLGLYLLEAGERADLALAVREVAGFSGVAYAEPNYVARPSDDHNDEAGHRHGHGHNHEGVVAPDRLADCNCCNFASIGLPKAWERTTGRSEIVVAVLDSGLDTAHEDLAANVGAGAVDLVNDDDETEDILGHGTAIAGLIAARGGNEYGITGVCWQATLLPVKIADSRGVATFAAMARGILHAVEHGARIINISMGSRADSQALRDAVRFAYEKGVLIVAPAGNDDTNLEMVPARYPEVLSVASTASDGNLATTTSLGFATDIAAPGENLITTCPQSLYSPVSGTSCASAIVAGAAALVLSVEPSLDGRQVAAILKRTAKPIPAVEEQFGIFGFGRLDVPAALAEASTGFVDAGIRRVRVLPERAKPGQTVRVLAEVANLGNRDLAGLSVGMAGAGKIEPASIESLPVGESRTVEFEAVASARANWTVEIAPLRQGEGNGPLPLPWTGDARSANDRASVPLRIARGNVRELAIAGLAFEDLSFEGGRVRYAVTVENRGNVEAAGVALDLSVAGDREYHSERVALPVLAPGASHVVESAWTVPAETPAEKLGLDIRIRSAGRDREPRNDSATFTFFLSHPDAEVARLQYQQSGDVEFIGDAPFRVESSRPYVPVIVFVPDNGGRGRERYLELTETKIAWSETPSGSWNLVYHDTKGAPPALVAEGLTIVDEDGKGLVGPGGAPDANLFGDQRLTEHGRHNILRVPLAALGVTEPPAKPVDRYIDMSIRWRFQRKIFFFFTWVKKKTYHQVLKISVTPYQLPRLPGNGHYYDCHFHTTAEWYHASPWAIFAPEKAYGGPIQMIRETAYAMGLIPSTEAIRDKIITTDHNCFFWDVDRSGNPVLNDPDQRPPYGPTSAARSVRPDGTIASEWQRYVDLFGIGAGEEVSFSQGQAYGLLPIGAHMLSHRGAHIDGTWHGGSDFAKLIGEGGPLYLDEVLHRLAKENRTESRHAFAYAAHPFSGQGWSDEHLDQALGLSEKYRTDRYVHPESREFVFKGLQLMNGRSARSLPSKEIDFVDMFPIADPEWQKGDAKWDAGWHDSLAPWHEYIANGLTWSFSAAKDRRFVRKVFGEAGTDAHGDFNYSTGRLATLIKIKATYSVDSTGWGMVRTYAFPDGKEGTTPGEQFMNAMADGNTVMTDGPIAMFDMDSDGRFDSEKILWHAERRHENVEGRLGGEGVFDGGRTMLVRKGSADAVFRYLYTNTPEFGSDGGRIRWIKIYKDEPGRPNPVRTTKKTTFYIFTTEHKELVSVGSLAPEKADEWNYEFLDPSQEGAQNAPAAYSLGFFTGNTDPDKDTIGVEEYRCYTNPVWALPVEFRFRVRAVDLDAKAIPAGGLSVELVFPVTMAEEDPGLELKILDAAGNSTDGSVPPIARFGNGSWLAASGVAASVYSAVNLSPIPLTGPVHPEPGKITYVVYTRAIPKDMHRNALNRIAGTLALEQGTGGGGGGGGGGNGGNGNSGGNAGNGSGSGSGSGVGSGSSSSSGASGTSGSSGSSANSSGGKSITSPTSSSGSSSSSTPASTDTKKKDKGPLGIGGCFVATASYDETRGTEEVENVAGAYRLSTQRKRDLDLLRDFRDEVLLSTAPGAAFVRFYYEEGPAAAGWLDSHPAAKGPVRVALAPAVLAARILLGRAPIEALLLSLFAGLVLFRRRVARQGDALL